MVFFSYYDSPLGRLVLAEKGGALAGAWLEGQKYFFGTLRDEPREQAASPVLHQARQWLDAYFAGGQPPISQLPLAPVGSEFRHRVWRALCEIPYGETATYGGIARKIAACQGSNRVPAQAVGGAVAHNPISIIIPCHRVVGTNGSLTGYAGGLQKKIWLLTHEGVDLGRFFVPGKEAEVPFYPAFPTAGQTADHPSL